ncbi:YfhO family protein [Paramuribaculum intestinale]|uniref:YfhO family protein n=1 Tax=Paramuribaculum intestinale TaxID=2094151 RepID=UPI0025B70381|nr:YfhO family protein [Paramuribaculum intestinale]
MEQIKQFLRSRSFIGTIVSLLAIAAISLAFFYPDALEGNVLRQHDMQQGAAIGHEAEAFREATGETTRWTNSLFSGMPTFQIAPSYPSSALINWVNTLMGLGLPSPANLVAMMMIGFFILLLSMKMRWYVALTGAIAYGFSSYFIIIIGAGHIWKFVTLAYVPPTIAGVLLCYRGRYLSGGAMTAFFAMMQIASNHVQMTYYFMFVIAGISIAILIWSAGRGQLRRWLAATGVLAVAGIIAAGANLPSLYNTYEYSKETMRGGHSELTQPDNSANSSSGGLDRDYITQYSYGTAETFTLLIPDLKGGASMKPEKGSSKMLTLADTDKARDLAAKGEIDRQELQYLGYMSQYFGEPEGTNGPVYVGALIVALFILGCIIVKGPIKWALLALTALSILLALGRNCMWLTDLMIDHMPMYSKFRTVESILVIAEFTMPLLAIMALQKLLTTPDAWQRFRRPMTWSFGTVLALCLAGILIPGIYGSPIGGSDRQIDAMISQSLSAGGADQATLQYFSLENPRIYAAVETIRTSMVSGDALRSFMIVAAGAIVLAVCMRGRLKAGVAIGAIGAIVLLDLFTVDKRYVDSESFVAKRLALAPQFPLSDADRAILADTSMNYRVMDMQRFWQADPSYHHKSIGGYHAAKLTRYQDLIDRHLQPLLSGNPSEADFRVLDMLNARYVITGQGEAVLNDRALGNAWIADSLIYVDGADAEMAALSEIDPAQTAVADRRFTATLGESTMAKTPGDTIFETTYAPNRLTYHARSAKGGVAVFSEVYFPWGWKATIDGKEAEIGRVNYLLRAMRIPAGSHTIEMRFDPDSLKTTTATAYASIILVYLALAAAIAAGFRRIMAGQSVSTAEKNVD